MATSQTDFIFNSQFYNQINQVAMDFSVAPGLANNLMGVHESKWLNEYNLNKRKFYSRYVYDILAAFENEQESLDNRYPNIKFTIEKQIYQSIAFLVYSFQVLIIKISQFKHITNRPIQDFC